MNPITPRLVLAGILLTAIAAATAIGVDSFSAERRTGAGSCSAEFQQLVGGLGCGPAIDMTICEHDFDPRLAGACTWDEGPLLGGRCFCSRHSLSIFLTADHHGGEVFDGPAR